MHASRKLPLKSLLSPLVMAMVLAAPCAFAKKDLFANEPGARHESQTENLVSASSAASQEAKTEEAATVKTVESKTSVEIESEKKPSYLESQLTRLKGHLVETKEDLFGSKKTKKAAPETQLRTEQTVADSAPATENAQPEAPTLSATEAAQRAQTYAEGQVINVRKYQEEDKPRYAVKLLQKNGRMKTINLDAITGEQIEEIPQ